MAASIYDFVCEDINNVPVILSAFEGKLMLVVNTASYCGYPSNQFVQEPHDNKQIHDFCLKNYGVTFPMFAKIKVNGPQADPLFGYIRKKIEAMIQVRCSIYRGDS